MAKSKKIEEAIMPLISIRDASKIEGVSEEAIKNLIAFRSVIEDQTNICSKNGSYDHLDEWSKAIHAHIHKMLKKNGFVDGKPEKNTAPDVSFWWLIYIAMHDICFSQFMSSVGDHHASAYERNEALKKEIDWLINAMRK